MKKITKKLSVSAQTIRTLAAGELDRPAGGLPPVSKVTQCYCPTDRAGCSNWCGGSVLC